MEASENRGGVAILVPVAAGQGVSVTLPADVLARIDAYAEAHGLTRAGFLASAVRTVIEADAA